MFFEDIKKIPEIAKNVDCAIFVIPKEIIEDFERKILNEFKKTQKIWNPHILTTEKDKKEISIEQVRDVIQELNTKEKKDQFIFIYPADRLNGASGNAMLKNLEEPREHYHFLLFTSNPSDVMSTILSRSAIYIYKLTNIIDQAPTEKATVIEDAKKLIAANPKALIEIADKVSKGKDNSREKALTLLSTAIELSYKSYFKTKNPVFLKKLPKLTEAYTNINNNGHIKIHLIADLL